VRKSHHDHETGPEWGAGADGLTWPESDDALAWRLRFPKRRPVRLMASIHR
jgi:hypothetical protein